MSGATTQTLGQVQYPVVPQNAQAPVIPGGSTLGAVAATAPDTGTLTAVVAADVALACTLTSGTSSSSETGASVVLSVECAKGDSIVLSLQANAGPSRRVAASVVFTPSTTIPGDLVVDGNLVVLGQFFGPTAGPVFNVANFGASPTLTDNTVPVQKAINAASAVNARLDFGPGIFKCTGQLTVPAASAITMQGAGKLGTILLYTGLVTQPFLIFPGQNHGSVIRDMTVCGYPASPAVQILSNAGSGTNGYQSLVAIESAWIGFYYPPGGNPGAGVLSIQGLAVQCDVFKITDSDVWGRDIGVLIQEGTTDFYAVNSIASSLPQGGEANKVAWLCDNITAFLFSGTANWSNCSCGGTAGTTGFRVRSVGNLSDCYCEATDLPVDVTVGVLNLDGGHWGANSTATHLFRSVNSSGRLAPAHLSATNTLTDLFNASSSPFARAWDVHFPPKAAITGSLPATLLAVDAPGEIRFPGQQMGYQTNLVHITHAQNGYVAQPGDVVLVDATSGATFVQLPAPAECFAPITVKKIDSSANLVEINHNGVETIDGANNITWTTQYEAATVASDGTNWFVVNQVATSIL